MSEPEVLEVEAERPRTIWEKLSAVARDCSYIRRDGTNQFHRYNYATAANVLEKVNMALWDHRLASVPEATIYSVEVRKNAKGGDEQLAVVRTELSIMDLDSEMRVSTVAFGAGMDNGDKAVMKAQTAALKYCWLMLLNVSTGDDPEADATVDSRAEGLSIKKKTEQPKTERTPGPIPQAPPDDPPAEEGMFGTPEIETCKKPGCTGQVMTYTSQGGKKYRACHSAKQAYAELVKGGIEPEAAKKRTAGHTYHYLSDPKAEAEPE